VFVFCVLFVFVFRVLCFCHPHSAGLVAFFLLERCCFFLDLLKILLLLCPPPKVVVVNLTLCNRNGAAVVITNVAEVFKQRVGFDSIAARPNAAVHRNVESIISPVPLSCNPIHLDC